MNDLGGEWHSQACTEQREVCRQPPRSPAIHHGAVSLHNDKHYGAHIKRDE
jgi:hypothetical protein